MSFYEINLGVFAAGNAYLLYKQYNLQKQRTQRHKEETAIENQHDEDNGVLSPDSSAAVAARKFQIEYFSVYALAVAADWLQVRCVRPTAARFQKRTPR